MKRRERIMIMCVGLLFVMTGFIKAETEPNDDYLNANTLELNVDQAGSLVDPDNNDWFKVTVPSDGKITVSTTTDGSYCPVLYFYDQNATTELGNTYWYSCGATYKEFVYNNITPGVYYIRVNRYSGSGSYTLKAQFTEASFPNDIENNDSIESAVFINENDSVTGHYGYYGNGNTDINDWFKIQVSTDGKLSVKTYNELTGCLIAYLYDQDSVTELKNTYWYSCGTADKEIIYNNLIPGTYFLKIYRYDGYGSYALKTEFTDAFYDEDPSSNDSIEGSINLILNDSVTGHLGFFGNQYTDLNDYYSIDIPTEGKLTVTTTSENTACLITYLIDQDSLYDMKNTYWISCGTFIKTLEYNNIAPGRYFLKVNNYSGYSPYILKNEFVPAPSHIDTTDDDSLQVSRILTENDTVPAVHGYYGNRKTDVYDWWKIELTRKGIIKAYTWSENTLCEIIYLKDSLGNDIATTYWYSCSTFEKTLQSGVLDKGTYYIMARDYDGYGLYRLSYDLIPVPVPEFSVIQNLFDATTSNLSEDGETYQWDFGDGQKSDQVNPKHTYSLPGVYNICLTAANIAGSDMICHEVEFKGIQSITPRQGGNTGDVTVTVYGGGFTDKSSFWFTDGSNLLVPDTAILVQRGALRGTFDLRGKDPGIYNLVVDYGDGVSSDSLKDAFIIEEGMRAQPWVNIVGRDKILFNRWQTYTINYGNNGNVDATGVPLWVVVPRTEGTIVRFDDLEMDLPLSDDPVWQMMKDSIPIYLDVDTFDGVANKVRIYPLFIPVIPAGQTFTIKAQVKTDSDMELIAWMSPPLFQSPVDPDVAECIRWAQVKAVANGMINILNEQLPGVACVSSVMQSIYGMTYGDPQPISSHLWNISRSTFTCASEFFGPLKAYKISVAVIELGLDIYENFDADNECRKPKPDPDDPDDPPFNDKPRSKRKSRAVSSFDPNEIVGPSGYTDNNYVKEGKDFGYSIYFENKATATAPAGEVIIIDTLDTSRFDLSSFELTYVNFGDTTFIIPQGLQQYSVDIDLRPTKPIIVRINASLDTLTGVAKWQYISLDTLTMDLTEDPDAGFLSPNINAPEGEGHVGYKIDLNKNLAKGSAITNKAIIYFDANPPIYTNIYTNYIDNEAPESKVTSLSSVTEDSTFTVSWSGSDDLSGIAGYNILVSEDNGDYQTWIGLSTSTSAIFTGKIGKNYKFKSYAIDQVGNKEALSATADAQTSVTVDIEKIKPSISTLNIFPNPAKNYLTVSFMMNKPEVVEINIYDQTGRQVTDGTEIEGIRGNNSAQINLSGLAAGIYFAEIKYNNNKKQGSFIILP